MLNIILRFVIKLPMSCNIFPYFMTFALHLFHMCAATRLCLFSLPSICFLSLFRTALPGILPFCLFRLPLFSFAPVRVIAPPPAFSPPSLFSFLSAAAQVLSFYISRPSTTIKKGAATCVAAPLPIGYSVFSARPASEKFRRGCCSRFL